MFQKKMTHVFLRLVAFAGWIVVMVGLPDDVLAADCSTLDTQNSMNECYLQQRSQAEAELTQVFQDLIKKLDSSGKSRLREAERAWMTYRDKECVFETADTIGGTVHSAMLSICLIRLIGNRTDELRKQLNCEEGDLSCVH